MLVRAVERASTSVCFAPGQSRRGAMAGKHVGVANGGQCVTTVLHQGLLEPGNLW